MRFFRDAVRFDASEGLDESTGIGAQGRGLRSRERREVEGLLRECERMYEEAGEWWGDVGAVKCPSYPGGENREDHDDGYGGRTEKWLGNVNRRSKAGRDQSDFTREEWAYIHGVFARASAWPAAFSDAVEGIVAQVVDGD